MALLASSPAHSPASVPATSLAEAHRVVRPCDLTWKATGQRKRCCAPLHCGWMVAPGFIVWFQLSSLQQAALRDPVLLKGDKNIPGGVLLSVVGTGGHKSVGLPG